MSFLPLLEAVLAARTPETFFRAQEELLSRLIKSERFIRKRNVQIKRIKTTRNSAAGKTKDQLRGFERTLDALTRSERKHDYDRRIVRYLGDTLACRLYPRHKIKALATNADSGLVSGKKGFAFEWMMLKRSAADHLIAVHHDLTHCLTIGDLSVLLPGTGPIVLECKSFSGEEFLLHPRMRNQVERLKVIEHLFRKDIVPADTISLCEKHGMPNGFAEIQIEDRFLTEAFMNVCNLQNATHKILRPEPGLVYICVTPDSDWQPSRLFDGPVVIGNLWRRIEGEFAYVPPISSHEIPPKLTASILDDEVRFYTVIDLGYVVEQLRAKGVDASLVMEDASGFLGFDIGHNGVFDAAYLGPKILHEVLYGIQSLETAIDKMLSLRETMGRWQPPEGCYPDGNDDD